MSYYEKYLKYKDKYNQLKQLQIGGGSTTVKLFKADWCYHCNAFKETWANLQKDLQEEGIEFQTFDANTHKKEIKEHNISGYPTILINNVEYNGDRKLNAIKNQIMKS